MIVERLNQSVMGLQWVDMHKSACRVLPTGASLQVMGILLSHSTLSLVFISKNKNICIGQIQCPLLLWMNITIFCFC